jgi:hypothetical protein
MQKKQKGEGLGGREAAKALGRRGSGKGTGQKGKRQRDWAEGEANTGEGETLECRIQVTEGKRLLLVFLLQLEQHA